MVVGFLIFSPGDAVSEETSFFGIPIVGKGNAKEEATPTSGKAPAPKKELAPPVGLEKLGSQYRKERADGFLKIDRDYLTKLERLLDEAMTRKNLDEANFVDAEIRRVKAEIKLLELGKKLPELDAGLATLVRSPVGVLKAYREQIGLKATGVIRLNQSILEELEQLDNTYRKEGKREAGLVTRNFALALVEENGALETLQGNLQPFLETEVAEYLIGRVWNVPKGRYPGTYEFLQGRLVKRVTPDGRVSWEGYFEVEEPRVIRLIQAKPKPPKGGGVRTIRFNADFSRFRQDNFGVWAVRVDGDRGVEEVPTNEQVEAFLAGEWNVQVAGWKNAEPRTREFDGRTVIDQDGERHSWSLKGNVVLLEYSDGYTHELHINLENPNSFLVESPELAHREC